MRKIIVLSMISLDEVMQTPGGSEARLYRVGNCLILDEADQSNKNRYSEIS